MYNQKDAESTPFFVCCFIPLCAYFDLKVAHTVSVQDDAKLGPTEICSAQQ